jgi:hypothetical protein
VLLSACVVPWLPSFHGALMHRTLVCCWTLGERPSAISRSGSALLSRREQAALSKARRIYKYAAYI